MELDFKSVKALSSSTRLKILRKVLERERTTTQLSEELDRSKSTISTHLSELTEAGLLEKDEKEGRRRVVYRSTRKADAIVNGKERKVKFSIASSVFTAAGGTFLIWKDIARKASEKAAEKAYTATDSGGIGTLSTESANATLSGDNLSRGAEAASQSAGGIETFFLMAGLGLLTISLSSLVYGLAINYLGPLGEEGGDKKVEVK